MGFLLICCIYLERTAVGVVAGRVERVDLVVPRQSQWVEGELSESVRE